MRRILLCLLIFPVTGFAAEGFQLNAQEYFERPGINVMYGQDYYPEGHQGGLSIIMHDERIASNGDVRLEPSPGQWAPIPKPGKREVNAATQEIRVPLAYPDAERDRKGFNPIIYPDLKLNYSVRARPDGESILVSVDFDAPIPKEWVGKVGFNLELFPGLLFGKSYQLGSSDGVFQRQPSGPGEVPVLARGKKLEVAPETELYHLTLEVAQRRRARAAGWPWQSQQRLVRGARAGARGRHRQRHRVARHAACEGGLDAPAGDPGVAGGVSPGATEAGHSRIRYTRHAPREREAAAHWPRGAGQNRHRSQAGGVGQIPALPVRAAGFQRGEGAGRLRGEVRQPDVAAIPHQRRRVRARGVAADAGIFPAGADVPHEGAGEIPAVAWRLSPG